MIHVMVVENYHLVRTFIVKLLSNIPDIQVIAEAENGEEAVRIAQEKSPHIILMDLKLHKMSGFEATCEILRTNSNIKIIILSAYFKAPLPRKLLQVGASGYLTKNVSVEEMIKAIRMVHARKSYISPLAAQQLACQNITVLKELSDRESQVIKLITNGKTPQDIAVKLNISPKTVNTYRYRLYEKLGVQNDVELTLLAMRYGILEEIND